VKRLTRRDQIDAVFGKSGFFRRAFDAGEQWVTSKKLFPCGPHCFIRLNSKNRVSVLED